MPSIQRSNVRIWIVPADTAPSALLSATTFPYGEVRGQITNYNLSGGESDVESVPAFGGFIDKTKPTEQLEVSLEITPDITAATDAVRWDALTRARQVVGSFNYYTLSSNSTSSTTVTIPGKAMIAVQALVGTNPHSMAYNNCDITQFELDHSADDSRTINLTFKLSPQTVSGIANYQAAATTATSLLAWTSVVA